MTTVMRTQHSRAIAASLWPARAKPQAEMPSGVASASMIAMSRLPSSPLNEVAKNRARVTAMTATRTMAVIGADARGS